MGFCPKCGEQLADNQKFCRRCGQAVTQTSNYSTGYSTGYSAVGVQTYNLITAYKSFFKNYAKFDGRSRRSEYWYAYLMNMIIVLACNILSGIITAAAAVSAYSYGGGGGALVISSILSFALGIYGLATIVPGIAIVIRRLHDIGKSGWYALMAFIPLAGPIILIVFMATDSQPGANQYGPNPKGIGNQQYQPYQPPYQPPYNY